MVFLIVDVLGGDSARATLFLLDFFGLESGASISSPPLFLQLYFFGCMVEDASLSWTEEREALDAGCFGVY